MRIYHIPWHTPIWYVLMPNRKPRLSVACLPNPDLQQVPGSVRFFQRAIECFGFVWYNRHRSVTLEHCTTKKQHGRKACSGTVEKNKLFIATSAFCCYVKHKYKPSTISRLFVEGLLQTKQRENCPDNLQIYHLENISS